MVSSKKKKSFIVFLSLVICNNDWDYLLNYDNKYKKNDQVTQLSPLGGVVSPLVGVVFPLWGNCFFFFFLFCNCSFRLLLFQIWCRYPRSGWLVCCFGLDLVLLILDMTCFVVRQVLDLLLLDSDLEFVCVWCPGVVPLTLFRIIPNLIDVVAP